MVMNGEQPEFELEYPCHAPDSQRWFTARVTRFGGQGDGRVVVAHENITTRKLADLTMRASEERFRLIARATYDAVWDWDLVSQAVWVNEAYFGPLWPPPRPARRDCDILVEPAAPG